MITVSLVQYPKQSKALILHSGYGRSLTKNRVNLPFTNQPFVLLNTLKESLPYIYRRLDFLQTIQGQTEPSEKRQDAIWLKHGGALINTLLERCFSHASACINHPISYFGQATRNKNKVFLFDSPSDSAKTTSWLHGHAMHRTCSYSCL